MPCRVASRADSKLVTCLDHPPWEERRGERWWLIGHIRVLGQSDEWEVLYDPETDEGRVRKVIG
jgi:hypothetical protein